MDSIGKVINGKYKEFANNGRSGNHNLNKLEERLTTAEADIDALESKMDANEESITTIEGTLSQHKITLDELAEKVADIILKKGGCVEDIDE